MGLLVSSSGTLDTNPMKVSLSEKNANVHSAQMHQTLISQWKHINYGLIWEPAIVFGVDIYSVKDGYISLWFFVLSHVSISWKNYSHESLLWVLWPKKTILTINFYRLPCFLLGRLCLVCSNLPKAERIFLGTQHMSCSFCSMVNFLACCLGIVDPCFGVMLTQFTESHLHFYCDLWLARKYTLFLLE